MKSFESFDCSQWLPVQFPSPLSFSRPQPANLFRLPHHRGTPRPRATRRRGIILLAAQVQHSLECSFQNEELIADYFGPAAKESVSSDPDRASEVGYSRMK